MNIYIKKMKKSVFAVRMEWVKPASASLCGKQQIQ